MEFLCCYFSFMILFAKTRAKGHFYYVDCQDYQRKIKQETGKKRKIVIWGSSQLTDCLEREKKSAFYGKTRDSFPSMSLPCRTRKRLKRFMSNFSQWYALEKYHCKLCYLRDTDKMDFLKATSLIHVSSCQRMHAPNTFQPRRHRVTGRMAISTARK